MSYTFRGYFCALESEPARSFISRQATFKVYGTIVLRQGSKFFFGYAYERLVLSQPLELANRLLATRIIRQPWAVSKQLLDFPLSLSLSLLYKCKAKMVPSLIDIFKGLATIVFNWQIQNWL